MPLLLAAAVIWLAIHLGLSGTALRHVITRRTGERVFRALFSLLALLSLGLLIYAYQQADTATLWTADTWLVALANAAMMAAFVLLACALMPPRGEGSGPRGILRVTRHPVMCAVALWSGAHLLANGDTAALVFFGALLLTVLIGVQSLDAKLRQRDPAQAAALHAATSIVPFAAILCGRNRLQPLEIGLLPPATGVFAYMVILHLHGWLLGLPAWPP